MAPPPEYDKEPKAPDKSASNISCEETKAMQGLVSDQQNISDSIHPTASASAEAENKHVEALDDGQLRALLDEAITYKCPKDREGKSSLFKELLEEVEQDEQACEAAARNLNVGRRQRNSRGGSSRHSVAQSNSLQDLVAALAAEPTPRRHHRQHNTPPATTVSARAYHGGSLPSGVDTSFLLGEEGSAPRAANYLATVRCVNPPPLGERRVSASDAPQDDSNRRSKPAYPMTYTARATLEIGSGGGSATRAVTTTTASNQVRTTLHPPSLQPLTAPTIDRKTHATDTNLINQVLSTTGKTKTKLLKKTRNKPIQMNKSNPVLWKVTEKQAGQKQLTTVTKSVNNKKLKKLRKIKQPLYNQPLVAEQKLFAEAQSQCHNSSKTNAQSKLTKPIAPLVEQLLSSQQSLKNKAYKSTQPKVTQPRKQKPQCNPFGKPTRFFQLPEYKRSPTMGPPERLFNQTCRYPKLYNPKSHHIYRYNKDEETDFFAKMKREIDRIENSDYVSKFHDSKYSQKNLTEDTNLDKVVKTCKTEKVVKLEDELENVNSPQCLLLRALIPKTNCNNSGGGGGEDETCNNNVVIAKTDSNNKKNNNKFKETQFELPCENKSEVGAKAKCNLFKEVGNKPKTLPKLFTRDTRISGVVDNTNNWYMDQISDDEWMDDDIDQTEEELSSNVNDWYRGLESFRAYPANKPRHQTFTSMSNRYVPNFDSAVDLAYKANVYESNYDPISQESTPYWAKLYSNRPTTTEVHVPVTTTKGKNLYRKEPVKPHFQEPRQLYNFKENNSAFNKSNDFVSRVIKNKDFYNIRQEYKQLIGEKIVTKPDNHDWNPRNVRKMTIGKPLSEYDDFDEPSLEILDHNDSIPSTMRSSTPVGDQVDNTFSTNTDCEIIVECIDGLGNNVDAKHSENTYETFYDNISVSVDSKSNDADELHIPIFKTESEQRNEENRLKLLADDLNKNIDIEVSPAIKSLTINEELDLVKPADTTENANPRNVTNAAKAMVTAEDNINSDDVSCSTALDAVKEPDALAMSSKSAHLDTDDIALKDIDKQGDIELVDMSSKPQQQIYSKEMECVDVQKNCNEGITFSPYYTDQKQLFYSLIYSNVDKDNSDSVLGYESEKVQNCDEVEVTKNMFLKNDAKPKFEVFNGNKLPVIEEIDEDTLNIVEEMENVYEDKVNSHVSEALPEDYLLEENIHNVPNMENADETSRKTTKEMRKRDKNKKDFQNDSKESKNGAVNIVNAATNDENEVSNAFESHNQTCIILNHPIRFITVDSSRLEIENAIQNIAREPSKKNDNAESNAKKNKALDRNILRHILMSRLFKDTASDSLQEVDSSIPFSCITTPEVVASCNTTSSSAHSAIAVDAKPLQLGWTYRAVTSLTGASEPDAADLSASTSTATHIQPRTLITTPFNGLPLPRPNYGTMAAAEEYKKPLDENGNSVQGYSSPLSGSSQHKKPRRKKSSKNEVVIKSHQIDGYQGNKDLNEVLRFIESNADAPRGNGAKLRKARHEDEDKPKKRERRKDKQPPQRAASLEEIAVSSLRELTTSRAPPAKPERRSWGDDFRPEDEGSPGEFQTVTKKRRWRRRETPAPAPTAARARRVSAPPSDRSDSNDDDSLHSLHSLPALTTMPALNAAESTRAPASYAEIARAANIPDLIESCNFYTEEPRPALPAQPPAPPHPPTDDYPALEPRRRVHTAANPPAATPIRCDKKERTSIPSSPPTADVWGACPAPDVVSEGRPPVILLDSARSCDIAGITFGFDINHQLLTGGSRRRGCDLVRDAVEGGSEAEFDPEVPDTPSVSTDPRSRAKETKSLNTVRYLPPAYTPLTPHLVQIIDYVGSAWDEVVRCGGGKVRYFSE